MSAVAPGRAVPPAVTAFAGLAVLVVALQTSGGFAVELLGPDLVLAAAGLVVTVTVLTAKDTAGWPVRLGAWYRDQLGRHGPLLLLVLLAGLAAVALLGRTQQVGQAAVDAAGGLLGVQNWVELLRAGALPLPPELTDLLFAHGDWYATRLDRIDPFGTLWLIALLVQFTLLWPLVLHGLRWVLRVRAGRGALRIVAVVALLAVLSVAAGLLRARWGADPVELAFGSHVRAAEFLLGATAGATAAALPRPTHRAAWPLAALGLGGLVASAVVATRWREDWLATGGPASAALATALVLLALHLDSGEPAGKLAGVLGRGLPLELGRSAYPILLLHAPVFWLIQLAVPGARPFALIAVGTALAWFLGLLVQDGLLRRRRDAAAGHPPRIGAVLRAGLAAALVAGLAATVVLADRRPVGSTGGPAVLVLGGSSGADAAAALAASRFSVVDATRPGCGLLPDPPVPDSPSRPTALAQAPLPAPDCTGTAARWRAAVAATRPVAVVLDLSADAAPRRAPSTLPAPCDPAFRALYRALVTDAVGALTAGAPGRPVLVPALGTDTGRPSADARSSCLDALLVEAVATHAALVRFDPDGPLCPVGYCRTVGEPGAPRFGDGVHLTGAGIAALAGPLEDRLVTLLAPDATATRTRGFATGCAPDREGIEDGC